MISCTSTHKKIIHNLGCYIPNTLHSDALLHGITCDNLYRGDSVLVTIQEKGKKK